MRHFIAAMAALVVSACATGPTAQEAPRFTVESPDELPALIPANVPAPRIGLRSEPDFDQLRLEFGKREDFLKRCELNRKGKEFMKEVEASRFDVAAHMASGWAEGCMVDAQSHLWAANAYWELGNKEESDLHMKWFFGITDSALKSGDGRSANTPIVTISVSEEYAVLARLGLEPVRQSLVAGPPALDLIEAKNKDGKKFKVYFNPYWHFVRLAHEFPDEAPAR